MTIQIPRYRSRGQYGEKEIFAVAGNVRFVISKRNANNCLYEYFPIPNKEICIKKKVRKKTAVGSHTGLQKGKYFSYQFFFFFCGEVNTRTYIQWGKRLVVDYIVTGWYFSSSPLPSLLCHTSCTYPTTPGLY